MPEISVLVPVYNAEKFLPQCLSSISAQTFKDFEIICVDDGSTDGSAAYLAAYAAQEPRLRICTQPNAGIAATRNRLLEQATGKYIAFVDADDWLDSKCLEKLYHTATQYQADVVRGLFIEHNMKTGQQITCDKRYSDYAAKRSEPVTLKQRFQAGLDDSQVWGKLILRQLLQEHQLRFCTGLVAEDSSFEILLYLAAKQIRFIDEYIYFYRVGLDTSITAKKLALTRGTLQNLCFLSTELERRGITAPEVYTYLLQLMVRGMRRFKHVSVGEQEDELFQHTISLIEQYRKYATAAARWKYGLLVKLTRAQAPRTVVRWSNLLR